MDYEKIVEADKPEQNEDKFVSIEQAIANVRRVVTEQDDDRIQALTSLVNTFNFAIQVQANRVQWQASDTKAFLIAMCALDGIGKTPTTQAKEDRRDL